MDVDLLGLDGEESVSRTIQRVNRKIKRNNRSNPIAFRYLALQITSLAQIALFVLSSVA
jgi:uncharacterized protein YccT (UPF0319 family)